MKYVPLSLVMCIAASCSEKAPEQLAIVELPIVSQAPQQKEAIKDMEHFESVEQGYPVAPFPLFAREVMEALPDSLLLDMDNVIYGDFNADAKEDIAAKVTNLNNGKIGVIIIHNENAKSYEVFGAGKVVNEMDNLNWIDIFETIPKGESIAATLVDPEIGDIIGLDEENAFKLLGEGIMMHVDEACGGGIIYWDGSKYQWMHTE